MPPRPTPISAVDRFRSLAATQRLLRALSTILTVSLAVQAQPTSGGDAEWRTALNVGKAQLENGEYASAAETFQLVLQRRPEDGIASRNLARALLLNGEVETALEVLPRPNLDPVNVAATAYLTGLAWMRLEQPAKAVGPLEDSVRGDPFTATARYQLAKAYEALARTEEALAQYREVVRLDPQHAAAHFELGLLARARGDLPAYRESWRTYQRLVDLYGDPETLPLKLEACVHTMAEAPAHPRETPVVRAESSERLVFRDGGVWEGEQVTALAAVERRADGTTLWAMLDGVAGQLRLVELQADGTKRRVGEAQAVGELGAGAVVRVGHFRDSVAREARLLQERPTFADVLALGPGGAVLLERISETELMDVTVAAGFGELNGRDAAWLDYEYDGDLDLLVVGEAGLSLWQNNGSGRFEEVAAMVGLDPKGLGVSLAVADLDANGGVDVVVAGAENGTTVWQNLRAGRFRAPPAPVGPWPSAERALLEDVDNDGRADVALVGSGQTRLRLGGKGGEVVLDHPEWTPTAAAWVDLEMDGWVEFCAAAEGVLRIWRHDDVGGWRESGEAMVLPTSAWVTDLIAADADGDGDDDLWIVSETGQVTEFRNDTVQVGRVLRLRLESAAMANHGGIGATIEVRAGPTVVARQVMREVPAAIGLGALARMDSVQVVWPDGTVDNLINVPVTGEVVTVERTRVITTGSCPYLYAWDGEGFRFVTDFLGSGALGLALTRNLSWPPDPVEKVRIGDDAELQPRDGQYEIVVSSELREVDYFDGLRVIAVDHPSSEEVHPTDSFMAPPVTPSELWAVGDARPLRRAVDSVGRELTVALSEIDGTFAPCGEVLPPPLRGVCRPIAYTLDFGPIESDEGLMLALTGLLEFGTASSNIALSQTNDASLVWPTLEAEDDGGQWHAVAVNLGIPDGRTKTNVVDLSGRLPQGTRRLRLTTSFQIYWDRIALFTRRPLPEEHRHTVDFSRADLAWRGFSRVETAVDGITRVPVFEEVSDQPPWHTTLEGWCTRYGDVSELLRATDGRLAVLNGGDAMTLEWSVEALPPKPAGWTRTFFLDAVGWDKEENANTDGGDRVEPLPRQPLAIDPEGTSVLRDDWTRHYNTRWVPRDRFAPTRANRE